MSENREDLDHKFLVLQHRYIESLPARLKKMQDKAIALFTQWRDDLANELHRELHNLSGSAAAYGFNDLSRLSREAELLVREMQDNSNSTPAYKDGIRNSLQKIEKKITTIMP